MLKKMGFAILLFLSFQPVAWAATQSVHITVRGMVCAFCAQGITKKFSSQVAVDQVKVSLEKKSVDLSLKSGQTITDQAIQKILTESGYTVEKIERH